MLIDIKSSQLSTLRWKPTASMFRLETIAILVAGLIIGGIVGWLAASTLAPPPAGTVGTFYVLATEWTFTIFDSEFKRVDKIEVNKGDRVMLIFLPSTFMPHELYEELEHEFIEEAIKAGLLKNEEEFEKYEEEAEKTLAKEAYGVEFIPHSLAIRGYEDKVNVISEGRPITISFTADKVGEFDIYCSLFCGWGHAFMKLEKAFVVKG